MNRALFVFRRDLRLEDNTGLLFALKEAKEVIAAFIFTPEQIQNNAYRSDRALQFMIESLEDLAEQLQDKKGRLYIFYGQPENIVKQCIESLKIDGVIVNEDYTPYSQERDRKIQSVCLEGNIAFYSHADVTLKPLQSMLKSDGKPYTVFTPFYRKNLLDSPAMPRPHPKEAVYYTNNIAFSRGTELYAEILPTRKTQPAGGRKAAFKILKELDQFKDYENNRNYPAQDSTTHLSAHIKFNTCSVREIYYALHAVYGIESPLIRSLYWHDFFHSIAFYFPRVFKGAFKTIYNGLAWDNNPVFFKKWCEGKTGFPLVDAGMRELNETGFMHNRVRMIVSSFLVKDLHINWQWGEKYFAQKLIDYDPAVNNGNWQWAASTGCDAQPYFRIFNPWSQSVTWDAECEYIKKWIPELKNIPPKLIHTWYLEKNHSQSKDYPAPIVDHKQASTEALQRYRIK
jgi:deoxyribodipyrimidine photo-lyase